MPVFYSLLFLCSSAWGNMEMSWPYPFQSRLNAANGKSQVDFSTQAPLKHDGSDFPCKHYHQAQPLTPSATYAAGSTYNITLVGNDPLGGGSCQIALSNDNGATFRVIKSIIGGCPLDRSYKFTVPSYTPAGDMLLAWTWQNLRGEQDFYMNCAPVRITTERSSPKQRRTASSQFNNLPYIWKANIQGHNQCKTKAGVEVVYPHPGPDVEY
ncbi:lytic polysaccharide monooxygenase, partial [Piedraia hortae CBS 480.64]